MAKSERTADLADERAARRKSPLRLPQRENLQCFRKRSYVARMQPHLQNLLGNRDSARPGLPILMTTLVTGATGFVGRHVARQLVAAGASVRVLVRATSNLAVLEALPVERVEGDLRDGASLDRAMQGVHCVCHAAAG